MLSPQQKFSIGYFLLTLLGLLLIHSVFFAPQSETLSYRDFKTLLKAGKVCLRTGSTSWRRAWQPDNRGQDRPVEITRTAPGRSSRIIRRAQVHDLSSLLFCKAQSP